jgi:hypothetical protein
MYNIAITRGENTEFFNGNDGKPRSYPTLADALVTAQYLGLSKQEGVELHFVKEGSSIEAAVAACPSAPVKPEKAKGDKQEPEQNPTISGVTDTGGGAGVTDAGGNG